MKYEKELKFLIVLSLIISAVALSSWTATVLLCGYSLFVLGNEILNRVKPIQVPEPTGAELLSALEVHKQETATELERVRSLLTIAQSRTQRPQMLRE